MKRHLRGALASSAVVVLAACGDGLDRFESVGSEPQIDEYGAELVSEGSPQLHLIHGAQRAAGTAAHLTYFGGPVLQNVKVVTVFWNQLVEAVTDAAVGLATTFGPPLAWYDRVNGEIGDICNALQGQVAGFTVQLEWSNSQNRWRLQ
jgi:hypothetical protein